MIVIDASVLAPALADDGGSGVGARDRLSGETLAAPELIDLEVASVLRRAVRTGRMGQRRAAQALSDLMAVPLERARHTTLLPRIWDLRDNATSYDAAYIALAETLETTLLTSDQRLARDSGLACEIEVLRP